jgi:S-methylmethionine-dependent homocysteine/selenocysteine methylase
MDRPLAHLTGAGRPVILDGAMGTELRHRGVDTGLPLWSANALLTAPETVRALHEEYIRAGAAIITTDTFRTTRRTFHRAGLPDRSAELTSLAVALAREAQSTHPGRGILIAGSVAPLEDCYHPELVPPDEELRREHAEHAERLAAAGVDFLLLETMGTVREARAAADAARGTGKEFLASFICDQEGRLLGGETINDAVRAIAPLSPAGFSLNCISPRVIGPSIQKLSSAVFSLAVASPVPLGVYANVGQAGADLDGEFLTDVDEDEYGSFARGWFRAGYTIIGGCCGTTPEYIRRIAAVLHSP